MVSIFSSESKTPYKSFRVPVNQARVMAEAAATVQQLNELRTMLMVEVQSLRAEVADSRAHAETRVQEVAADVNGRADRKFAAAQEGFDLEQKRISRTFELAQAGFKQEQTRMDVAYSQLSNGVLGLQEANLDDVVKKIVEQDERDRFRTEHIQEMIRSDRAATTGAMGMLTSEHDILKSRVNELQASGVPHYNLDAGAGSRGERPLQPRSIRIPDVGNWKLDTFNNNDTVSFLEWRNKLDKQLGFVWLGLDQLLIEIRDDKEPIVETRYKDLLVKHDLVSADSHPEDWRFGRIMKQIHTVIYTYIGTDARKVIAECSSSNGFEDYRLMHKEFDPMDSGSKFQLYQHAMSISRWPQKGLAHMAQAVRELSIRISTYERRTDCVFADETATGIIFQLLTVAKEEQIVNELKRNDALETYAQMKKVKEDMHNLHAASRPRALEPHLERLECSVVVFSVLDRARKHNGRGGGGIPGDG